MRAYADASFIVALYVPETGRTDRALAYMDRFKEALPFTELHRLEVRNAIRLRVWSKHIKVTDRSRAFREIEEDLDDQTFLIHTPIKFTAAFQEAEKIGAAHSETIGCRASDLFHIAAAKELRLAEFLSFDEKQRTLARAIGLKVDF